MTSDQSDPDPPRRALIVCTTGRTRDLDALRQLKLGHRKAIVPLRAADEANESSVPWTVFAGAMTGSTRRWRPTNMGAATE